MWTTGQILWSLWARSNTLHSAMPYHPTAKLLSDSRVAQAMLSSSSTTTTSTTSNIPSSSKLLWRHAGVSAMAPQCLLSSLFFAITLRRLVKLCVCVCVGVGVPLAGLTALPYPIDVFISN